MDDFPSPDYLANYEKVLEVVSEDRLLAHETMVYACTGKSARQALPESVIQEGIRGGHVAEEDAPKYREGHEAFPPCGFEHRVWLCVGVEGPKEMRDAGRVIPCPFVAGTCPECGGSMQHVRWNEDERFQLRVLPEDVPYFAVPEPEKAKELAARGYGGAEYVGKADPPVAGTRRRAPLPDGGRTFG